MRRKHGFTLIELLIVVVIIGILAAIAIPGYNATKRKGYEAQLKSDLRNLTSAQESHYYETGAYATDAATLYPTFAPTAGNTLNIVQTTPSGWSATATHAGVTVTCAVFFNAPAVAPATADGVIACQ
jgi:prepilin-type N-terminal cleavage/methylation domain-containing protein